MIAYSENIQVISGNSNRVFAETICKELGIDMAKVLHTCTIKLHP